MGGFHVLYREKLDTKYRGVKSNIVIPQRCVGDIKLDTADSNKPKTICPEFFFGFYKGFFGVDIGLYYNPKEKRYKTCVFSFLNTLRGSEGRFEIKDEHGNVKKDQYGNPMGGYWLEHDLEERRVGLYTPKPGETLNMHAYLDNDILRMWVEKSDGKAIGLEIVGLSPEAHAAFKSGCEIHREICMASNLKDNLYAPSNALFSDVTFKDGFLEELNEKYIPMTKYNTRLVPAFDDYKKPPKGFMPGFREIYNPDGTIIDIGSADCNYK